MPENYIDDAHKELDEKISKIILTYGKERFFDYSYSEKTDIANKLFDLLQNR